MKREHILFFTILISLNFILVTSINPETYSGRVSALGALADYSLDTDFTLKLEFLGFDEGLLNETEIEEGLNLNFQQGNPTVGITIFNISLEFNYASETEYNDFATYIETMGTNGTGTGYDLNATQLELDLASGERNDIFIPQDGLLMDAELTEEYIYNNLFEEDPAKPGYSLFFLNFSVFDAKDHSLEHWYKTESLDFDTNETISSWFSGFSDIPYVTTLGWGGDYRFCFLDLSARTWYYDWIEIAWGAYYGMGLGDFSYYDYRDIDELSQLVDIYSVSGNSILSEYISDYILSYILNVFGGYYYATPIAESYSLQVKVFNNLTNVGYTMEELNWVISDTRIQNQLEIDLPWIEWIIDVEYVNIQDYPILYDYIADNVQYDVNGPYVEIMPEFFSMLTVQLSAHFDYDAADVILPCYFFLNDEVGLQYDGIPFAGLGGMGWEILVADQYSLFKGGDPDFLRSGMSAIMIHELGHSLGYPHPHSEYYGWGSSFLEDAMNYFSRGEESFSTFYIDALARAHGNYFYSYASLHNEFAFEDFVNAGSPDYLVPYITDIGLLLQQASANYTSMDYLSCINAAKATIDAIDLFYYYLDDPSVTETPTPTLTETATSINFIFIAMTILSSFLVIKRKRK
ncbi:MAG: hypothetical protein GOP50_13170 [Candidatus Heimdallarchaeota archaeon]|nr:hypothetical protein [Candidatus Heimdallarchaeota archaeon]